MSRLATFFLLSVMAAPALAQTPAQDFVRRSPDIHWPAGRGPDQADLFAHNYIDIEAPCARVWPVLIAAGNWPQWYPNASQVQVDGGTLRDGVHFTWTTFGLAVESRVAEFVPFSRLSWTGHADGVDAYHSWLLTDEEAGCHVVTDEAVRGEGAKTWAAANPRAMHRGHQMWLETLKWKVEGLPAG